VEGTVTSERAQAYGRVMKTLDELSASKLLPGEQQRIRDAADTLIFAASYEEARATLAEVEALTEQLVESGRWSEERATELAHDLMACGPVAPVG
jgi:polyhydroxyalkanoate synthesis regulator phasin